MQHESGATGRYAIQCLLKESKSPDVVNTDVWCELLGNVNNMLQFCLVKVYSDSLVSLLLLPVSPLSQAG